MRGGINLKKLMSIVLTLVLILSSFLPLHSSKASNDTAQVGPKLKVLEIIDYGESKIKQALEKTDLFQVETTTMKKFVASRDEIDGNYDFIAISKGAYSTKTVGIDVKNREAAHKTTEIMNDITNLKADEIINQFIKKGQPVLLERGSMNNRGKLQSKLANFNNEYPNVIYYSHDEINDGNQSGDKRDHINCEKRFLFFYWSANHGIHFHSWGDGGNDDQEGKTSTLINKISTFLNSDSYKERPRFNLATKPSEMEHQYKAGDTLDFKIQMLTGVSGKNLKAVLYIDSDFNDQYDPSESVSETTITTISDTVIQYKLPRGYSGIRNWKIEVVDSGNNLKDYQKGTIKFKDQIVKVNVLQVTINENDNSSLLKYGNMLPSYLKPSHQEYEINLTVTSMKKFKEGIHSKINGKYDMLIFGFGDSYNNTDIGPSAAKSVENFINKTKQSVMFTHDTIFGTNNNWVNNFKDITGQKGEFTNLGHSAPSTSVTTQKINEGMMTKYPFDLNNNIAINRTHNQYYSLDLEDSEIIPWYNITGSERDIYDSYNHYYTYSKGNVTYSGTGHTPTNFPDEEQRLFVNTMYRAFLGSNHAPIITVHTPKEQDIIPEHQNIELSYTVEDFDLKDKKLSTKVFFNGSETPVYSQEGITNGATISQSIKHNIVDRTNGTGTPLEIKIQVIDESGAIAEKVINVKILKVSASLEVSREVDKTGINPVNEPVTVNYYVQPQERSSGGTISNVIFSEKLPPYMEVEVPIGFNKTGTLQSGYTITADLGPVVYKGSGKKFNASLKEFSLKLTPKDRGVFLLGESKIMYKDLTRKDETASFNPVTINSKYKIEKIELPESYVVNKGIPENFGLKLKIYPDSVPSTELVENIEWIVKPAGAKFTIDPKTGVLVANDVGEATVTVKVRDAFGNEFIKSTLVTVRIPIESIHVGDIRLKVGEVKSLDDFITVSPAEAKHAVTIELARPEIAKITKEQFRIEGLIPGETIISVKGINRDGNEIRAQAKLIVEGIPLISVGVEPEVNLDVTEEYQFEIDYYEPENATNKNLKWVSEDPSLVKVLDVAEGIIKGVDITSDGPVKVFVYTEDGKTLLATILVTVGSPLKQISAPENYVMEKGKVVDSYDPNKKNSNNILKLYPEDATNIVSISFKSSNESIISIDSGGVIHAKRLGEANVTFTVVTREAKSSTKAYTVTMKVLVVEKGANESEDDRDLY